MQLEYLTPITGRELEMACNDPVNSKLAKYISKHYVFDDRVDFPQRPGKMASRKIWEDYEKRRRDVAQIKADLHARKEKGIFTLYRNNTYIVSVDGDKYYILSGNNEKDAVPVDEVKHAQNPVMFAGRRVQGNKTCMYVPFCGAMYTLSLDTGYYSRI